MKLCVLALDYDGTISRDDTLDPDVCAAIDLARSRGIVVILVTGRTLAHLRRDAGDLRWADAVVAENGAVLAWPNQERALLLARPPAPELLDELQRRAIPITVGECVIEADAALAPDILAVIRELELPLALVFNRGRLMVLPQSVSKATGLSEALRALRLSPHNAIAIGDAENDHAMLELCEVGAAVAWGSPTLQRNADLVLPGTGPADVAAFIRRTLGEVRLPAHGGVRHWVVLGTDEHEQTVKLAVRGRNVLIAGDARSGKSWVAGLLCEQLMLQRYCVCVIDPEGDYRSLEALPGVLVASGAVLQPLDLLRELRYPDLSIVVDLTALPLPEKKAYVTAVLPLLASLRRQTGLPHRILVDEAHYFLHDPEVLDLIDLELAGYTLVTYQASNLHPRILDNSEAVIVTHASDAREVQALHDLTGREARPSGWAEMLNQLPVDEAVLLPGVDEAPTRPLRFRIAPRITSHVRHRQKYIDLSVGERRAFIFTDGDLPTGDRAETMHQFAEVLRVAPFHILEQHLRRHDFSRWIAEVFGDFALATEARAIEEDICATCPNPGPRLAALISRRYGTADGPPDSSRQLLGRTAAP